MRIFQAFKCTFSDFLGLRATNPLPIVTVCESVTEYS